MATEAVRIALGLVAGRILPTVAQAPVATRVPTVPMPVKRMMVHLPLAVLPPAGLRRLERLPPVALRLPARPL
jgi:hypothetical protein